MRPRLVLAAVVVGVVAVIVIDLSIAHHLGTSSPRIVPAARAGAPNVLLIVTDDQRLGSLSSMPLTKRLFKQGGVTFKSAYDTTPLCCPSRSSIFTGQYAHNHGVLHNGESENLPIGRTIQRYLHDAGYLTTIDGKYIGWNLDNPPYWDRWTVLRPPGYYDVRFNVDGEQRTVSEYTTDFLSTKALDYLDAFDSQDDRPWFLYLSPNAPHPPATPEDDYRDASIPPFPNSPGVREKNRSDKPPFVRQTHSDKARVKSFYRGQLRALMSVDDMVQAVFDKLDALGETRSTLALFISDNGYMWGEHGLFDKRYPYTESIKVPMFMRWPGHVTKGRVVRRLVANIDIAPTILKAAGIDPPLVMDGHRLLGRHERSHMFNEYFRDVDMRRIPTWASIRTKRYQYIEYYNDMGRRTFREYYDLRKDPHQLRNLLADGIKNNVPNAGRLHRRLLRDRRCSGRACP